MCVSCSSFTRLGRRSCKTLSPGAEAGSLVSAWPEVVNTHGRKEERKEVKEGGPRCSDGHHLCSRVRAGRAAAWRASFSLNAPPHLRDWCVHCASFESAATLRSRCELHLTLEFLSFAGIPTPGSSRPAPRPNPHDVDAAPTTSQPHPLYLSPSLPLLLPLILLLLPSSSSSHSSSSSSSSSCTIACPCRDTPCGVPEAHKLGQFSSSPSSSMTMVSQPSSSSRVAVAAV